MQQNLHQQKITALIIAGLAFISLLLNWSVPKVFAFVQSKNGFNSWGLLSLLGILAVVAAAFMGNRTKPYEGQTKQIATAAFALVALGAALYLVRLLTGSESVLGESVKFNDILKPGTGLFICLVAGLAGFAWVYGLIKSPNATTSSTPPPNP